MSLQAFLYLFPPLLGLGPSYLPRHETRIGSEHTNAARLLLRRGRPRLGTRWRFEK